MEPATRPPPIATPIDTPIVTAAPPPPPPRMMIAAYSGSPAFALALMKDFPTVYLGMSGAMTYGKNDHLRELAFELPRDRYVLCTDTPRHPAKAVGGGRGAMSLPNHVPFIAEAMAKERRETVDEVLAAALENTCRLFALP